jgi:hypothetical protein
MAALKGGCTECIMHCNRGYTGGQDTPGEGDALEWRMNWEERIHSRGGYSGRVKEALEGRMHCRNGCTEREDALKGGGAY